MKLEKKRFDLLFFCILLILVLLIIWLISPFVIKKYVYPKKYAEFVKLYCTHFEIDENLCFAVIKAESNFDKDAKSRAGAIGLMQITLPTAVFIAEYFNEYATEQSLKNPEINIKYGTYYLSYLSEKFNKLNEVLAAYNAGEGRVLEWLKDKQYSQDGKSLVNTPFKETNTYVNKTLKYYKNYKRYYKI